MHTTHLRYPYIAGYGSHIIYDIKQASVKSEKQNKLFYTEKYKIKVLMHWPCDRVNRERHVHLMRCLNALVEHEPS